MLRTLVHLIGAIQFSYGIYYDYNYVLFPDSDATCIEFGGKFVFLTFWDEIIQALFCWICLLNDLIGTNENNPKTKSTIRNIKDFYHTVFSFPLGVFVASVFWILYAIDRELILPSWMDPYFPAWLNHVVHTNVAIFTALEMITSFRVYPSRKSGLKALLSFMMVYLIWSFIIYFKTDKWVYPVLFILNWPLRIIFFLSLFAYVSVLYILGEYFNSLVWSQELKRVESEKKRN